jgi:hypothetical protein
VVVRDQRCVDCGAAGVLEADHVVPLRLAKSFDPRNGVARCLHCHRRRAVRT